MPSSRLDEDRDYAFADQVLALRRRARLTQHELAALLGVSEKAIGAWERGLSYPAVEHLQQVIALAKERGVFTAGRDEEEAAALWETVRERAPRHTPPFDPQWFAELRAAGASNAPNSQVPAMARAPLRHDWGEAPDVPVLHGRTQELATLTRWVNDEHCRVVAVLGGGGVGKTALTARLAQELAPTFPVIYWRSLRNALPVEEWLAGAITTLSAAQTLPPEGLEARLGLVLDLLRGQRALLVLDNLETVLKPEEPLIRYRSGYEGYGEVLQRLGTSAHQSCLVLTSRERPLGTDTAAARSLRLGGLGNEEGRALLSQRGLVGVPAAWKTLVEHYTGNPLALGVVGETIAAVFDGDIAVFLSQGASVFGDIRQLLDEQITRLSSLEYAVLLWLAVEREPIGFGELVADLGAGVARSDAVEAVEALQRRSLLERGGQGTFTLQPVVLEYATARLVEKGSREIAADEPALLVSHALVKALANDFVRQSQEQLIAQPLLAQLRTSLGGAEEEERRLRALLERWRGRHAEDQGYGPGNVTNLLRLLRGTLRGLDLSHLGLHHVYFQEADAQDSSLVGSHLTECALAEAFDTCLSVTFSPDGEHVAAGTFNGEVCVWRLADRMRIVATPGHTGPVLGIDWAGDGHVIATAGFEGIVKLWDAQSGRLQANLEGHTGMVLRVSFAADGQLLASGSMDGTVRVWETRTGRLVHTLHAHESAVWGVSLSDDGTLVASASIDGTVKLWNLGQRVRDGALLATLKGDGSSIYDVALTADGQVVAGGGQDGTIRLWEVATGRLMSLLQGHTGRIWRLAPSADGRLLVSGGQDGTLRLWDITRRVSGGACVAALEAHAGPVYDVAISPDTRTIASVSQDVTVRLWEVPTGKLVTSLQGYARGARGLAWDGSGRLLANGIQDGTINLWDVTQGVPGGALRASLQGDISMVYATALSDDGQLLASCSQDGTIRLWNVADGAHLRAWQAHAGNAFDVTFSPDARLLVSCGQDRLIKMWDVPSGEVLVTLQAHTDLIWSVALSGDGHLLASASQDGTIKLWEIPSGQLLATMRDRDDLFWGVAFSRDGALLASAGQSGRVNLWETPSGRPIVTLGAHEGPASCAALSRDGRVVASGGADGAVMLWDVTQRIPTGELIARCTGHDGPIHDVAVSPAGSVIASSSQDGTVMLWDAQSGVHRASLRPERQYERMDITGLTGVSEEQMGVLKTLGAIEHAPRR